MTRRRQGRGWVPIALRALLTGLAVILAGCAGAPRSPNAAEATTVSPAAAASPSAALFEKRLNDQAILQESQGRLADASTTLEVLTVLRPDVAGYVDRLAALKARVAVAVKDRLQRADEARRRGQNEIAASQYLSALALQPENRVAADALRAIERDRNRRLLVARQKQKRTAPLPEIGD